MGNSYPSRFNANGVWKINEISKNKVTNSTWPGLTGHRGVFGGGYVPGASNVIDYVNIQTAGNATDFGDLTVTRGRLQSASASRTRGCFYGGNNTPTRTDVIDFITISTTGNATDFGNMITVGQHGCAANNNTRGIYCLGDVSDQSVNTIEQITFATTGNGSDFGDRTVHSYPPGGLSSQTRMVMAGGYSAPAGYLDTMDFIEMSATGNAVDFGNLGSGRSQPAGCSSSTRGIFCAGHAASPAGAPLDIIEYVTIASHGNAIDFGDMTAARSETNGSCSNAVRGVLGGGNISDSLSNVIDQIQIATTGNASDFGDLSVSRRYAGSTSNGNGGLT